MASKTGCPEQSQDTHNRNQSNLESAHTEQRALMPTEYYDEKHPWFGSQIHYTIDVFRQLIRDTRARKQHSSKDGGKRAG